MVRNGDFFAVLSQDTDSLLFGSSKVVKNLSISGKRKKAGTHAYETINPEIIDLAENLNNLGIDNDQLIVIAMLCGTDFNIGGIKGLGPKKSLTLVKQFGKNFDALFKEAKWDESFSHKWKDVFDTIKKIPTSADYYLKWNPPNEAKIYEILVKKHDFDKERVEKALDGLIQKHTQKGLNDFF